MRILVYGPGASVTDGSGNVYQITSNGQISINGTVDPPTSGVQMLAYYNGAVYQRNSSDLWYSQTSPNLTGSGWKAYPSGDLPVPFTVSANDTAVAAGSNGRIINSTANQWTITSSGQVAMDGVADKLTANVTQLAYVNGYVWQENASGLWWAKTGGSGSYDGWSSGPGTDNSNGTRIPPLPPGTLTWIGGGNNLASNFADWSPATLPIAGDTLVMDGGTMNVVGNVLAGDTVQLADYFQNSALPANTFNLSGNVAMNVAGGYPGDGTTTINLANGSDWTGSFSTNYSDSGLTIQATGGGTGEFSNVASVDGSETNVIINANIVGTGTISVEPSGESGTLEFMHGVSSGQTVELLDEGRYQAPGFIKIDDPADYHATTVLGGGGLTLEGLTATSYDISGDILSLFKGNAVAYTLTLAAAAGGTIPQTANVAQIASGIVVDNPSAGGTLLPVHT